MRKTANFVHKPQELGRKSAHECFKKGELIVDDGTIQALTEQQGEGLTSAGARTIFVRAFQSEMQNLINARKQRTGRS